MDDVIRQIQKFVADLREFVNDLDKIPIEIAKEMADAVYEDINYIFETCIDKYYADYSPKFYKRTYAIKDIYKIKKSGTCIEWDVGADLMPSTHRVSNKYINTYMFEFGFHGGAKSDKGLFRYRTKPPVFTVGNEKPYMQWSKYSSKQSRSPSNEIDRELGRYEKGKANITGHTVVDLYKSAKEIVFGRYSLFK